MKKLYSAIIIGVFALCSTACNNGTGNVIDVTPPSLTFAFDEATPQTLTVSAADWTITAGDQWIHATPTSGAGMASISVTVDVNDTGVLRSGKITISSATAASRTVNIVQDAPGSIPVSSIALNTNTLALVIDDTAQLSATITPPDATLQDINWSSSNSSKVSVSDTGLVTAVAIGEATITATAADGSGITAQCSVTVGAKEKWARSNIVWIEDSSKPDGGYLTFAVSSGNNTDIPSNSQGVMFVWGSLVAISPVSGQYSPDRIIFSPTGDKSYAFNSIPSLSGYTVPPFDNNVLSEDDFATYNTTGFNEVAGNGDICRYISSKGWVNGNWRMPVGSELAELSSADKAMWAGFANENVPAEGKNPYGFYKMTSGTSFGAGVSNTDNKESPAVGVALPASGYYAAYGTQSASGNYGCYWSGSSFGTANSHELDVNSFGGGGSMSYISRGSALAVRCVRE